MHSFSLANRSAFTVYVHVTLEDMQPLQDLTCMCKTHATGDCNFIHCDVVSELRTLNQH